MSISTSATLTGGGCTFIYSSLNPLIEEHFDDLAWSSVPIDRVGDVPDVYTHTITLTGNFVPQQTFECTLEAGPYRKTFSITVES